MEPGTVGPAPPAGEIVTPERNYAVGLGVGSFRWDDGAPFDDMALGSLTIERKLWGGIRGRAGVGAGMTALGGPPAGDEEGSVAREPVDTDVYVIDLQILAAPDFGPFEAIGTMPYVLAGVGSLVTDPSSVRGRDLPTRSQSHLTYGAGVVARVLERWEARAEVTRSNFRLADPFEPEDVETDTIHNLRWEGRLSWLF